MKRIGVLRGGAGENYFHSLKKGGEIISYLAENFSEKYKPVDILVDKEGLWHVAGRPVALADLMHRVDLVWNVAHPHFSHSLDNLSIPHISPAPFFSALKGSRELLREHLRGVEVSLPRTILIPLYQKDFDGPREKYALKKAKEIHEKFGAPWLVKSFTPDANMGIHLAKTFPELVDAIEDGVNHGESLIVEEFISGKIASIHSMPDFRNEDVYVFPLSNTFGAFSSEEKELLYSLAKHLHQHLNAGHYLKSDFLLTPRRKVYLLEFENVPEVKAGSHFAETCELAGTKIEDVVAHILERSLSL
ncbi:MAG: hypothetical protein WCT29_01825 [Candidatus Paceibacterota bacterium]|jgi:D-alanine-D-alanine ligase-like ATP-grasp enzyme